MAHLAASYVATTPLPARSATQRLALKAHASAGGTRAATRCSASTASNAGVAAATSRREALGMAVAVVAAASVAVPAAATADDLCTLTTAANGIQFCDVVTGSGPEPKKGALIRCHYTGRLASNGRVFDSSYERRRPLNFKIGVREVIAGWDAGILGSEGMPAMREGGKRRLVIPPELAYGDRGAGGVIPPKSTLIFDVELLGKK